MENISQIAGYTIQLIEDKLDIISLIFVSISVIISLPSKMKIEAFYFQRKLRLKNPHKIARSSFYLTFIASTTIISFYFLSKTSNQDMATPILLTSIVFLLCAIFTAFMYGINRNKTINYNRSCFEKKINTKLFYFIKSCINSFAISSLYLFYLNVLIKHSG